MAIAGEIKDISLPGIIQILCLERRMAQLSLSRRGEDGVIFFENGDIVHAKVGSFVGEEALFQLLSWNEGTFHITDKVSAIARTIAVNWNHLLMEGMRRIDERKRRETLAHSDEFEPALSSADIERDTAVSNELLILISAFEQYIPKMEDRKVQKRPETALELLCEIINRIVEVAERVGREDMNAISLKNVLINQNEKYSAVRLLFQERNRLSVQTAINLYSSWANDPADRGFMFRRLGHAMADILDYYFSFLVDSLQLPNIRGETREIVEVFIGDLRRALDGVRF